MHNLTHTNQDRFDGWLNSTHVQSKLDDMLFGADDGDLYLQQHQAEYFSFSDQKLQTAQISRSQGFGVRLVCGELVGNAFSNAFSHEALGSAIDAVSLVKKGHAGRLDVSPAPNECGRYAALDPTAEIDVQTRIALLQTIDAYVREKDPRIVQVSVSLSGGVSTVDIVRAGGERFSDVRPLVQIGIHLVMSEKGRTESGMSASGGRHDLTRLMQADIWRAHADDALRMAATNLTAEPAPAGSLTVVLEAGYPGMMVHEAVGHGLEGDAVFRNRSVYAGQLGEQVAARGVTIIDDGRFTDRRGSLTIDDEGTPSQENVLIEDGILKGYMHDRLSARMMGVQPTGNGRRQSYAYEVLPRMTNTYMANGQYEREEIIASVKDGIYAVKLGSGQVDPTSGDFVFECTEAYRILNGKVEAPISGATIVGNGPVAMKNVAMVGKQYELDSGTALCGKMGQSVPVGVGQPMVRMDHMTVGGTA